MRGWGVLVGNAQECKRMPKLTVLVSARASKRPVLTRDDFWPPQAVERCGFSVDCTRGLDATGGVRIHLFPEQNVPLSPHHYIFVNIGMFCLLYLALSVKAGASISLFSS